MLSWALLIWMYRSWNTLSKNKKGSTIFLCLENQKETSINNTHLVTLKSTKMTITLYPTDKFLCREYDSFAEDEYNLDEISDIISQNIEYLEVKEGKVFEIPKGYQGQIESDQFFFRLIEFDENQFFKEPIEDRLSSGRYIIEGDCIRKIEEDIDMDWD